MSIFVHFFFFSFRDFKNIHLIYGDFAPRGMFNICPICLYKLANISVIWAYTRQNKILKTISYFCFDKDVRQ